MTEEFSLIPLFFNCLRKADEVSSLVYWEGSSKMSVAFIGRKIYRANTVCYFIYSGPRCSFMHKEGVAVTHRMLYIDEGETRRYYVFKYKRDGRIDSIAEFACRGGCELVKMVRL